MKEVLIQWGKWTPIAMTGVLYYVFLTAYSHPTKSVVVVINRFGEANIELVLLPVIIITGIWAIWHENKKRRS